MAPSDLMLRCKSTVKYDSETKQKAIGRSLALLDSIRRHVTKPK